MDLTPLRPSRDVAANVLTPPARLIEPRLAAPKQCGAVLLFEQGDTPQVSKGMLDAVDAWADGRTLLRKGCILLPLQRIPDRLIVRLGERYRDGSYLRLTAPAPPPVFAPSGDVMEAGDVYPGSLVQCAVSFTADISGHSRIVRALLEWVEVRIALPANARWDIPKTLKIS